MSQRLTITLSDEIYSRLKEQAERDYRTIGAEICYLLQLHVPNYAPALVSHSEPYPRPPFNPTAQPQYKNNKNKKTIIG